MSKNLVSITTEWGFKRGGINSFNYDLCIEFARANPTETWKTICLVYNATGEMIAEAAGRQITLISLDRSAEGEYLDFDSLTEKKRSQIIQLLNSKDTVFVGHDIFTSDFAIAFSNFMVQAGGNAISCSFHHMDYEAYYQLDPAKGFENSAKSFREKFEMQKRIFRNADIVYGVGPKLKKSAVQKRRKKDVKMFVPGMSDNIIADREDIRSDTLYNFRPVIWGRVEAKNDPVKQYSLALAAFGSTLKDDAENEFFNQDCKLYIIGVLDDAADKWLSKISHEHYGARCFNSVPQTDREWLINNVLLDSHLSLMLSTHDGFGLVGLESIAAEVPLILSRNTGIYELLKELMDKKDEDIYTVKIVGDSVEHFSKDDLKKVKEGILKVRKEFDLYLTRIKIIRLKFLNKYSWEKSTLDFSATLENCFEVKEVQKQDLSRAVDNVAIEKVFLESKDLYVEGKIQASFEVALKAMQEFPSSSKIFLRLTKAAVRLGNRDILENFLEKGLIEKDDNYFYSMMQFERTFERNYKQVLNWFDKIKVKENVYYYYEAGVANFFLMLKDKTLNSGNRNRRLNISIKKTLKYLKGALKVAEEQKAEHWWVDVMLLLVYKSYPKDIDEADWAVNKEDTHAYLNGYITKYPLKASPRIYRFFLLMIFDDEQGVDNCIEEDQANINSNPDIFLPLDFVDSVFARIMFLYADDLKKNELYHDLINRYKQLYKNRK